MGTGARTASERFTIVARARLGTEKVSCARWFQGEVVEIEAMSYAGYGLHDTSSVSRLGFNLLVLP